tara:strand:- start:36 stop:620 length:585 start_codon:yes stop_codon:yes gene_type:complete
MTSIVLIDKGCNIKETKVKNITRDNLYAKCGFRKKEDFDLRTTWELKIEGNDYKIELWTRNVGKAGTENKYDFPPPVDNELYFGTCGIININKENDIIDLTINEWNKIYENLFGGFEDLDSNEEQSEDELENVPDELKSNGYLKDGFVVSSTSSKSDDDSDYNINSEIEEEEYIYTDEDEDETDNEDEDEDEDD